ncbi:cell wall-binding protein [Lacrimispora sp.]|uniref:cell wall-binding protein n=1 Tax=Lacrimispora sp. TaxID=2719234 RepID=UPI0028AA13B7|nr:cell wall-binding protein [Lacrimispora sp.]
MKKQKLKWIVPCAAALFTIGASMTSFAAQGWVEENNSWVYYNNDGDRASDSWKKSGDSWFYLDDDGQMVDNQLVESDGNYYYVNSNGAMVTNEWRELPSDDDNSDEDGQSSYWYYFGSNGKAYKATNSGKTNFKSVKISNGEVRDYAFDTEGRMLFGWVNEDAARVTGDDAWKEGTYFLGAANDGAKTSNAWKSIDVDDNDNTKENFDGKYWFYFGANGKKMKDTSKTINGRKYRFNEFGAAESEWYEKATSATATNANQYYNLPEQSWLAKGWFKTVPSETIDAEAHDNGDEYWFYSNTSGDLVTSQIKTINGLRYAFNEKGEMLDGLYKLTFDSSKTITSYDEIETEADFPAVGDEGEVYYFGTSPKEGAMTTGKTTIDIDGEKYTYNFRKSGSNKGAGYNGINDDSIYIQGRMLKADKDDKYKVIEFNSKEYLVGTSGKLAKNKSNVQDGDGKYYKTNSDGTIKESGYDKLK